MAALDVSLAGSVRIYAPATSGAIVQPMELKACARVRRMGAVLSGPMIEA